MLSDIIVMMIKKFKLTYTDSIKIILAMYILVILLSQLFTFETFPAKIADAIGGSLTAGMVDPISCSNTKDQSVLRMLYACTGLPDTG